jgi:hypothetical protein
MVISMPLFVALKCMQNGPQSQDPTDHWETCVATVRAAPNRCLWNMLPVWWQCGDG